MRKIKNAKLRNLQEYKNDITNAWFDFCDLQNVNKLENRASRFNRKYFFVFR